jgi:hypothetical protein
MTLGCATCRASSNAVHRQQYGWTCSRERENARSLAEASMAKELPFDLREPWA